MKPSKGPDLHSTTSKETRDDKSYTNDSHDEYKTTKTSSHQQLNKFSVCLSAFLIVNFVDTFSSITAALQLEPRLGALRNISTGSIISTTLAI